MLKFCILLSARLPLPVITVPLLAVQSGLPSRLAFEPLCLNTCVRVGAGGCARTQPSHLWGPGQGYIWFLGSVCSLDSHSSEEEGPVDR